MSSTLHFPKHVLPCIWHINKSVTAKIREILPRKLRAAANSSSSQVLVRAELIPVCWGIPGWFSYGKALGDAIQWIRWCRALGLCRSRGTGSEGIAWIVCGCNCQQCSTIGLRSWRFASQQVQKEGWKGTKRVSAESAGRKVKVYCVNSNFLLCK